MATPLTRREIWILSGVLLLALLFRGSGLAQDLPYLHHSDETKYLKISQKMFRTGDLTPPLFNIPSLLFDVTALAHVPYYLVGKLAGLFASRDDILSPTVLTVGVSKTSLPSAVLWARSVMVLFSLGTVAVVFLWGRLLTARPAVGVLAALVTAVSPVHVSLSRLVTPDTLAAFFVALAALFLTQVFVRGRTRDYLLSGVAIGLAASAKYNAALVIVLLPAAHWLGQGKIRFPTKDVWLALLAAALGFIATSPITVIDFPRFVRKLSYECDHYATGHAGMEGDALGWYFAHMGQTAVVFYVLAGIEIVRGLVARSKQTLLMAVFPLIYFAFISTFVVRNDRTFLPLTFFCFVLSASLIVRLFDGLLARRPPRWQVGLAVALLVGVFAQPVMMSYLDTRRLGKWLTLRLRQSRSDEVESAVVRQQRLLLALQAAAPRGVRAAGVEWHSGVASDRRAATRGALARDGTCSAEK